MLRYLRGESKIPDPEVSCGAVDEDVVALDVSVDHVLCVEELETLQDLSAPPLHSVPADHWIFPQVTARCACVVWCGDVLFGVIIDKRKQSGREGEMMKREGQIYIDKKDREGGRERERDTRKGIERDRESKKDA